MAVKKRVSRSKDDSACCEIGGRSICGGTYGLGFVGAVIYFIKHAVTFWGGVLGILKAMVWPALVVYKLMEFLKF